MAKCDSCGVKVLVSKPGVGIWQRFYPEPAVYCRQCFRPAAKATAK